jgi:hypothetical protein
MVALFRGVLLRMAPSLRSRRESTSMMRIFFSPRAHLALPSGMVYSLLVSSVTK